MGCSRNSRTLFRKNTQQMTTNKRSMLHVEADSSDAESLVVGNDASIL